VAIAILRYFPHGGLQRIALDVAVELERRGHHVRVFTQEWKGPRPDSQPDTGGSLRVETLRTKGFGNHGRAADFGRQLASRLREEPADVVLGFDRLPGLDLYFAGDPCYSARIRRDRSPLHRFMPRSCGFLALERAVFGTGQRPRVLLMDGREQAIIQREYGTEDERFRVLPPGFSATRSRGSDADELRARIREELRVGDDFLGLALGSDFRRKGFDRALRALKAVNNSGPGKAVLAIAGSGGQRSMKNLAAGLGVSNSVRWLGARDDVPALLQGADLLVHPCRSEPAGMVLLEALSAGTPVLVTGAAGYAPYVQDSGAGEVLSEPFQQEALASAWIRIMSTPRAALQDSALGYAKGLVPGAMTAAVAEEVEGA
jgi:UDP-glucose:(heptosyl)LPS alpha-1,3-glucosyltransferase